MYDKVSNVEEKYAYNLSWDFLVFSSLAVWKPGEEDHVEDEDESTGAEDRDDDGQDDVQLPVLLLLQAEPWLKVRVYWHTIRYQLGYRLSILVLRKGTISLWRICSAKRISPTQEKELLKIVCWIPD